MRYFTSKTTSAHMIDHLTLPFLTTNSSHIQYISNLMKERNVNNTKGIEMERGAGLKFLLVSLNRGIPCNFFSRSDVVIFNTSFSVVI